MRNELSWGICKDGGVLCNRCLVTEKNLIDAAKDGSDPQWEVIGHEVVENGTICDHCGAVAK